MPYKNKKDRNYKQERQYDGRPDVKKRRAARNRARYKLMKEGKVRKGDGKDVDHKKPLTKGGSNKRSNLRAVPASKNRSYKRTSTGAVASKRGQTRLNSSKRRTVKKSKK
jgi:5-methylcytosine-specific restriction endonuclease McrA